MLALFNKAVRRLHGLLRAAKEVAVGRTLPALREVGLAPLAVGVEEELDEAAAAVREEMREKFRAEDLQHFAVGGTCCCSHRAQSIDSLIRADHTTQAQGENC